MEHLVLRGNHRQPQCPPVPNHQTTWDQIHPEITRLWLGELLLSTSNKVESPSNKTSCMTNMLWAVGFDRIVQFAIWYIRLKKVKYLF